MGSCTCRKPSFIRICCLGANERSSCQRWLDIARVFIQVAQLLWEPSTANVGTVFFLASLFEQVLVCAIPRCLFRFPLRFVIIIICFSYNNAVKVTWAICGVYDLQLDADKVYK